MSNNISVKNDSIFTNQSVPPEASPESSPFEHLLRWHSANRSSLDSVQHQNGKPLVISYLEKACGFSELGKTIADASRNWSRKDTDKVKEILEKVNPALPDQLLDNTINKICGEMLNLLPVFVQDDPKVFSACQKKAEIHCTESFDLVIHSLAQVFEKEGIPTGFNNKNRLGEHRIALQLQKKLCRQMALDSIFRGLCVQLPSEDNTLMTRGEELYKTQNGQREFQESELKSVISYLYIYLEIMIDTESRELIYFQKMDEIKTRILDLATNAKNHLRKLENSPTRDESMITSLDKLKDKFYEELDQLSSESNSYYATFRNFNLNNPFQLMGSIVRDAQELQYKAQASKIEERLKEMGIPLMDFILYCITQRVTQPPSSLKECFKKFEQRMERRKGPEAAQSWSPDPDVLRWAEKGQTLTSGMRKNTSRVRLMSAKSLVS